MKAAVLHAVRDVRVEELPDPGPPGRGEALVRVLAVGVCGSDVHYYRKGRIGSQVLSSPQPVGHEAAGEVVAVGEGASLRPGQLVAIEPGIPCGVCESCRSGRYNVCREVRFLGTPPFPGAYVELLVWPEQFLHPLPEGLGALEGAMCEPLAVAVHAVGLAGLEPGCDVAVLGSGSIGLLIAACARARGARRIFSSDLLGYRVEAAGRFGATQAWDASDGRFVERVMSATGGRGVDVSFEAAGSPESFQEALDVVRPGGKVVFVGICEEEVIPLRLDEARRRELSAVFSRRFGPGDYPTAVAMARAGQVDLASLVTHRFPVERIAEAFALVEGYSDGVIKALVEM